MIRKQWSYNTYVGTTGGEKINSHTYIILLQLIRFRNTYFIIHYHIYFCTEKKNIHTTTNTISLYNGTNLHTNTFTRESKKYTYQSILKKSRLLPSSSAPLPEEEVHNQPLQIFHEYEVSSLLTSFYNCIVSTWSKIFVSFSHGIVSIDWLALEENKCRCNRSCCKSKRTRSVDCTVSHLDRFVSPSCPHWMIEISHESLSSKILKAEN